MTSSDGTVTIERQASAAKPARFDRIDPFDIFSLMSARDICTRLRVSKSHWWAMVAEGKAPFPAIRGPRFTRWRAADVAAWINSQQNGG